MFPSVKRKRLAAVLIFCLSAALPAAAQEPAAGAAEEKPAVYDLAFCKSCLERERSIRTAPVRGNCFVTPDNESELRKYESDLYQPTELTPKLDFVGSPAEIERCREIAQVLDRYDTFADRRAAFRRLMTVLIANDALRRAHKLSSAVLSFEELGPQYKKHMNGYDTAYRKFVEATQKLKNNKELPGVKSSGRYPWNVDFVDVFNYAGLNEYALKVLRAQPYFENEMRALDNLIVSCNDSKLNEQKSMLEALMKEWEKAHTAFSQAKEAVLKRPAYADIKDLVQADQKILDNARSLLSAGFSSIEYLYDPDTIGGSLRTWKNVAATAFNTGDSISTGGPVYTRRLRKSLIEVRRIWNDAVAHFDVAYGSTQGWHKMKY